MDQAGIGALIGSSIVFIAVIGSYIYDRCNRKQQNESRNPLLVRHRSFKGRNLFSHVEI